MICFSTLAFNGIASSVQDMHIEEQRQRRREREEAREMEAAPKQKRVDTTAFLARLEESNKVRSAQPKRPWPGSQLAPLTRLCGAAKAGELGGEAGAAAEKGRADVHRCATDQRQIEAAAGWQRYRRLLGETHRDPAAPQHAQPLDRDARSRHLPGLQQNNLYAGGTPVCRLVNFPSVTALVCRRGE